MHQNESLSSSDVRQQWSSVVNRVASGESRVVIEKDGLPVAALISTEDLARLQRFEARAREALFATMERMREAFADVPEEELERQIDQAVAEVRVERRAQHKPDSLPA